MKLNLYVLTPKRIIWDCEVKEIILSTNRGQIGVLPNHAPINTAVDMGPLRIRLLNDQWLTAVLWSGFARIVNNEIIILGNDAELGSDIDPKEAQQALEIAEANLSKAEVIGLVLCILIQTCYLWSNMDKRKLSIYRVCLRLIYYEISILNGWLEIINFKV
uniref:Uncharacterized protein n=1 Tax=Avena sativa TaxID=4498 RepID=A0ACD6AP68_AVESA